MVGVVQIILFYLYRLIYTMVFCRNTLFLLAYLALSELSSRFFEAYRLYIDLTELAERSDAWVNIRNHSGNGRWPSIDKRCAQCSLSCNISMRSISKTDFLGLITS